MTPPFTRGLLGVGPAEEVHLLSVTEPTETFANTDAFGLTMYSEVLRGELPIMARGEEGLNAIALPL